MRVLVKVDGCLQMFDVIYFSALENDKLVFYGKDPSWNIVVKGIQNQRDYINKLLQDGYLDLSSYYSYIPKETEQDYESFSDEDYMREIDLFEMERGF